MIDITYLNQIKQKFYFKFNFCFSFINYVIQVKLSHMIFYEKSNATTELPNLAKLSAKTKNMYVKLFTGNAITQAQSKNLADAICNDLGVPCCPVDFAGVQRHSKSNGRIRSKTLGDYHPTTTKIRLFQLTAAQKKTVANKTMLNTLLHELCHHFDYKLLSFYSSKHTKGFYMRIISLHKALLA